MATFKEHLIKERTEWRDTILEKFYAGEYHKVLFLMAYNYGEHGTVVDMIERYCDNADPMDDWRRFV